MAGSRGVKNEQWDWVLEGARIIVVKDATTVAKKNQELGSGGRRINRFLEEPLLEAAFTPGSLWLSRVQLVNTRTPQTWLSGLNGGRDELGGNVCMRSGDPHLKESHCSLRTH